MSTAQPSGQDILEWRQMRVWDLRLEGWRGKDIAAALGMSASASS